jgi:hypothetical protein
MEKNFRKEKTMRKMKLYLIIIFGLCSLLFVGMLNKGYEYYEPEICLKYPTFKMIFIKPDLPDDYKTNELPIPIKKELNQYNRVYEINENLGDVAKLIAVIILQLFLTFVFIKLFEKYALRYFVFDVFLFFFSATVLFILISLDVFKKNEVILIASILGFNFLFNYVFRNVFFSKIKSKEEDEHDKILAAK